MIDNLNDILNKASQKGIYLTKFLDEASCGELKTKYPINIFVDSFGGFSESERKRVIFHRDDISIDKSSFGITTLKAPYNNKFYSINHRQVLGTLMSLGIERETIGDIVVKDDEILIFCVKEMKDFIITNLRSIARASLEFKEIEEEVIVDNEEVIMTINVQSLRLDAVISKVLNISREKSQEIIKQGLILLNHQEVLNDSKILKESDLLSVRKFGRIRIYETINVSKKNRLNVRVGVIH